MMGAAKREEQEREAKLARGGCVCRSRVIRTTPGVFRTIHDANCPKFKLWMTDHIQGSVNPSGAAHAAAIHNMPDFDGATYSRSRDHVRLGKQMLRVLAVLRDGEWHTLPEIAQQTGDPEASISARIRDNRKEKFGGRVVEREHVKDGLWRYRLVEDDTVRPSK